MTETETQTIEEATQEPAVAEETPQETAEAPEAPDAAEDQQQEQEAEKPSNREARYRRQLRETEAERDTLRGRVEALQRGEVARLAAAEEIKAEALWASGAQLADLLAEDGTVDAAKVDAAIKAAAESLGLETRGSRLARGLVVRSEGGNPAAGRVGSGWADAFTPKD